MIPVKMNEIDGTRVPQCPRDFGRESQNIGLHRQEAR